MFGNFGAKRNSYFIFSAPSSVQKRPRALVKSIVTRHPTSEHEHQCTVWFSIVTVKHSYMLTCLNQHRAAVAECLKPSCV